MLQNRGPDSFKIVSTKLNNFDFIFAASVLSLRGNHESQITVQPIECAKTGNVFLWNGEIFSSKLFTVGDHENDGAILFEVLNSRCSDEIELLKIFEQIEGPYAFVYYVKNAGLVYFGRDRFGRRSLLIGVSDLSLTLSSVKVKNEIKQEFQELKANGIYKICIKGNFVSCFSFEIF